VKLANIQFAFLPDEGGGLKCCLPGKSRPLARMVPDVNHPGMWRLVRASEKLSDMVNKARAKDACWGVAETAVFLGQVDSHKL